MNWNRAGMRPGQDDIQLRIEESGSLPLRSDRMPAYLRTMVAAAALGGAAAGASAQPLLGHVESHSFIGPVTGQAVNFNIYLPQGYAQSAERYPVIYHLHGITGSQGGPQNSIVPASFEAAKAQGIIGAVIVVFPNGYADSWWADSIDGVKPAETDVVQQLIPHVDANFRTIATRGARIIEGFSMGGFGATKFYSKFPNRFAACVEYDGALVTWQTMLQFHAQLAASIFGNSEAYFNQFSPWYWTSANAAVLADGPPIRMVVGALVGGNQNFRDHLLGLDIPVNYVTTGCAHDLGCLFNAQGLASAAFIAKHLDLTPHVPGDVNGDGAVNVDDLVAVILAWGPCPAPPAACTADVNGSGTVDVDDLVTVILNWG
jgi:S-formylglutathione hydrolase FrmB